MEGLKYAYGRALCSLSEQLCAYIEFGTLYRGVAGVLCGLTGWSCCVHKGGNVMISLYGPIIDSMMCGPDTVSVRCRSTVIGKPANRMCCFEGRL